MVFAQIGIDSALIELPNWIVVQNQQASVVLPMTAMIVTDDLPLMDGFHITVDSYRIIGKPFAETYWDVAD